VGDEGKEVGLDYNLPLRGISRDDGTEDVVKAIFRRSEQLRDRGNFRHVGSTSLKCVRGPTFPPSEPFLVVDAAH